MTEPVTPEVVQEPTMSLFDLADAKLTPDADNMNLHNKKNLDAIETSVDETGFNRSIFIDENNVVRAGNGTYEVAKKKNAKILIIDVDDPNTLVAVRRKGMNDLEKKRAGLWDNESARLATRNKDAIKRLATENPEQMLLEGIISEKDQSRILREHENAQPLAVGGAEDAPEFAVNKTLPQESHVKMIQLFFNKDNIAPFMEKVNRLQKLFTVKNTTEAIEAIINRAFAEWIVPEAAPLPAAEAEPILSPE